MWPFSRSSQGQSSSKGKEKPDTSNLCKTCFPIATKPFSMRRFILGTSLGSIADVTKRERKTSCACCKIVLQMLSQDPMLSKFPQDLKNVKILNAGASGGGLPLIAGQKLVGYIHVRNKQSSPDSFDFSAFESGNNYGGFESAGHNMADMEQLRSWYEECETTHSGECAWEGYVGDLVPILLIDVIDRNLIRLSTSERYLALSYVWGTVTEPMFTTLLSNRLELEKKGSLDGSNPKIPRVVQDAMALVKGLRERYLWVDTLCIIQDDLEDKMTQIKQMDRIYSQAIVTIVAVSGNSAQDPLPGLQMSSRQPPSFVEECPAASFCSQPPPLASFMDLSTYQSRAWTLQEKLLSKRCLYFTNRQIYFECPNHMASEVGESTRSSSSSFFSTFGTSGTNALTILRHNLAKPSIIESGEEIPELSWVPSFAAYRALVVEYSRRKMTNQSDSLNAFAGISSALQNLSGSPFVCGIPEVFIDLALLWVPKAPLERRLDGPPGTIPFTISTNPTWSWAGWIGAIDFLVLYEGGGLSIPEMQELNFKTEICIIGVQRGSELHTIARSKKFENPYDGPAPPHLITPPLPVDVLHIVADTINAEKFWKQGGKFFTSDATNMLFDPKQPMMKLWNRKMGGMWNLKNDMTAGPAATHFRGMGQYNYKEYGMKDTGLKKLNAGESLDFILLSRCKWFPPGGGNALLDTVALAMELERDDNPDAARIDLESGRGKPWVMMNVMLVRWKGTPVDADGYAERVMVGHVHEDAWAKCAPKTGYLKLA